MSRQAMTEEEKGRLISEFVDITGADQDRAKFYMESSSWDIQTAMESFYDTNDSSNRSNYAQLVPAQRTLDDDDDVKILAEQGPMSKVPYNNQKQANKPSNAANQTAQASNWPPKPQEKSRFATLSDVKKETRPNKSTSDDESDADSDQDNANPSDENNGRQSFFVGGGGQQVLGPKKPNPKGLIEKIFKEAKAHGAVDANEYVAPESASQNSSGAFAGQGNRLDGATNSTAASGSNQTRTPTSNQAPRIVRVRVAMFQNGFTVDDGPLRKYEESESQRFLGAIMKQLIPHELTVKHRGAEIDLHLENRKSEEYVPPKVSMQPFSGQGYMLGSPMPEVVGAGQVGAKVTVPTTKTVTQEPVLVAPKVDATKPTTRIQIRLLSGERLVQAFNVEHTVADVRSFVESRGNATTGFIFGNGAVLPQVKIGDESLTLEQAGLLNGTLVQMKS